jgi:ABC-2 type transport system ATP-binding protein
MDHGQILEEGTVEELVSNHFKERAVRFETIPALTDERLRAMPGASSVKHEDGEVIVYTRDVAGTIGAVLAASEALGLEPANLGVRRPTLEDVFLDLTGRALRD